MIASFFSKKVDELRVLFPIPLVFFFVLGIFLVGCASGGQGSEAQATDSPAPSGSPQLRVANIGAYEIENLTVIFPDERVFFGNIAPGNSSEYKSVTNGVYRYAAYEFEHEGELITQPVIDWVGETPMEGSQFTYTLDYEPARSDMERIRLVQGDVDTP